MKNGITKFLTWLLISGQAFAANPVAVKIKPLQGKTEVKTNPRTKLFKSVIQIGTVPFADFNVGIDGNKGTGDGNGEGNGEGGGAGGNGGGNGGNANGGTSAADNARNQRNKLGSGKQIAADERPPGDSNGKGGPHGEPPADNGGGDRLPPPPKYWWPVCVFVDSTVSTKTANDSIKGMIDRAAATCNVLIKVEVATVDWSKYASERNADQVLEPSRSHCNVSNLGVSRGSTTSLVRWPLTAAAMCNSIKKDGSGELDPATLGCAELAKNANLSEKQKTHRKQAGDAGGHGSRTASGGVAASIEVPDGHTAGVVSHEALGHSQMGKPNGGIHGHGIGEEEKEPNGSPENWTGSGCAAMVGNAYSDNKDVWDPKQKNYYQRPEDAKGNIIEAALYKFNEDPPLFGRDQPPPPGNPEIPRQIVSKARPDNSGDSPIPRGSEARRNTKVSTNSEGVEQGHKKKKLAKPKRGENGRTSTPTTVAKADKTGAPAAPAPLTGAEPEKGQAISKATISSDESAGLDPNSKANELLKSIENTTAAGTDGKFVDGSSGGQAAGAAVTGDGFFNKMNGASSEAESGTKKEDVSVSLAGGPATNLTGKSEMDWSKVGEEGDEEDGKKGKKKVKKGRRDLSSVRTKKARETSSRARKPESKATSGGAATLYQDSNGYDGE